MAIGFQRLDGRLEDPIHHRDAVRVTVHHRADQRRAEGESPTRRVMVRGLRGGAGEQPGRAGQTADDQYTQAPPRSGVSGAVRYAVRAARSTCRPVIVLPLFVGSCPATDCPPKELGDIGHSVLVTKRHSRGHAGIPEK